MTEPQKNQSAQSGKKAKVALVLSGGGARGAYQVGVLKGVSDILKQIKIDPPFKIIAGSSAGSINTAKIAATSTNFFDAVDELVNLWSTISTEQVFQTNLLSFKSFGLGGFLSQPKSFNSFLDTSPLRKLIADNCDFNQIQQNLENGIYESILVTANNYSRNAAYTFIQMSSQLDKNKLFWKDSRRISQLTQLTPDHILASSSIPMLFSPVFIENEPYGDGCVRNSTPCSPAIRMGAEKLFVIGVRSQTQGEVLLDEKGNAVHSASLIRILNTLLNAVLLDSVEQDVQRIQRINHLVEEARKMAVQENINRSLKIIPSILISPSQDIGVLARKKAHHIPRVLRMSMSTFGHLDEASELISYLLFNSEFCEQQIEMGYKDATDKKNEIIEFFENENF